MTATDTKWVDAVSSKNLPELTPQQLLIKAGILVPENTSGDQQFPLDAFTISPDYKPTNVIKSAKELIDEATLLATLVLSRELGQRSGLNLRLESQINQLADQLVPAVYEPTGEKTPKTEHAGESDVMGRNEEKRQQGREALIASLTRNASEMIAEITRSGPDRAG